MINPVHEVVELAARFQCRTIIDAMSSFGALATPIGRGVAAVVSSANKCLEGAPGVAFVLARTTALATAAGNAHLLTLDLSAQLAGLTSTGEWRFTARRT
ncbi:MAG TPA: hypothetical protein VHW01_27045 [Polyangiaceae bacterium]|nr:hypothetical protein [Polyangiaceae bacterium]